MRRVRAKVKVRSPCLQTMKNSLEYNALKIKISFKIYNILLYVTCPQLLLNCFYFVISLDQFQIFSDLLQIEQVGLLVELKEGLDNGCWSTNYQSFTPSSSTFYKIYNNCVLTLLIFVILVTGTDVTIC